MTEPVENILERFGQRVTVRARDGSETEARAFVQPLSERSENVPEAVTAIGWTDGRLWLYLGRTAARAGDEVAWNGERFRVRSGRPCCLGGELSHWRAVLERAKEAAGCGS